MEDRDIVQLYLQRDERAVAHTADKYGARLQALAMHIVEDSQTAEECENDAYLQAWESIPPHEPYDYLYAYLARITRHVALNRCRRQQQLKRAAHVETLSAELEQCLPAPDEAACRLDEQQLTVAINGFLATLDSRKRRVFVRRYWYMDSVEDIARRCGLSPSNVKSILFRSRGRLREYLIKEGYDL